MGGVAVVLHGHVRTTVDVDVYTAAPAELARALQADGFGFDPSQREFTLGEVPVYVVTPEVAQVGPRCEPVEIEGIRTLSLADLINMKLHAGLSNMLRAQDLADVIGLIRRHRLKADFAGKIDKAVRGEFRKLARAVAKGV